MNRRLGAVLAVAMAAAFVAPAVASAEPVANAASSTVQVRHLGTLAGSYKTFDFAVNGPGTYVVRYTVSPTTERPNPWGAFNTVIDPGTAGSISGPTKATNASHVAQTDPFTLNAGRHAVWANSPFLLGVADVDLLGPLN